MVASCGLERGYTATIFEYLAGHDPHMSCENVREFILIRRSNIIGNKRGTTLNLHEA